ncbi:MAG TPA: CehA/McbA family metallohydrolase, partial [Longimicrobiales bacterium]|nr:CehA/McbA family metallohydrolase [Longimicrobiales bacterium]
MKPSRALPLLLLLLPAMLQAQRFEPVSTTGRWYKGNTHSHTINTDGDSPPDTVVKWYKTNGYNFLVVSDHDTITEPSTLRQFADSAFILVRGEEVTGRFERVPVHLTALNPGRIVKPRSAASVAATLQANIDAVRAAGGVPLINHPNYRWALDQPTLANSRDVLLFELYNGHPHVHNDGGGESPSTEALWDALLSTGRRIYGVASDDSHHWLRWGREHVNPGKGWIYVRADRLDPAELVRALEAGQFYASTGVELEDYRV